MDNQGVSLLEHGQSKLSFCFGDQELELCLFGNWLLDKELVHEKIVTGVITTSQISRM